MIEIIVVDSEQYHPVIREIFREYLQWANERIQQEYDISFEIDALLEHDMQDLGKFMPPSGRLLLGFVDRQAAGIACLKSLTGDYGELKRMYVSPGSRGIGLGRSLVERLFQEAGQIGYTIIRLDSARFMEDAHRLYRKLGFHEIEAYEGSEIPPGFQAHWVFMQKELAAGESQAMQ